MGKKKNLERKIFDALGKDYCGNKTMPLDHDTFYYKDGEVERVVSFLNDAHELGFGYKDEWHTIISRKGFHKIVRWYLKRWALGEWFGLRRYLWYKFLFRSVNRHKKWVNQK
jgi:hypothetical protein